MAIISHMTNCTNFIFRNKHLVLKYNRFQWKYKLKIEPNHLKSKDILNSFTNTVFSQNRPAKLPKDENVLVHNKIRQRVFHRTQKFQPQPAPGMKQFDS